MARAAHADRMVSTSEFKRASSSEPLVHSFIDQCGSAISSDRCACDRLVWQPCRLLGTGSFLGSLPRRTRNERRISQGDFFRGTRTGREWDWPRLHDHRWTRTPARVFDSKSERALAEGLYSQPLPNRPIGTELRSRGEKLFRGFVSACRDHRLPSLQFFFECRRQLALRGRAISGHGKASLGCHGHAHQPLAAAIDALVKYIRPAPACEAYPKPIAIALP